MTAPRYGPCAPSRRRPRRPPAATARLPAARRRPRATRGRSSRERPSHRPRRPRHARSWHTPRDRHRRSRRSRSAGPRAAGRSPPRPRERHELVRDDVGRVGLRERPHRLAHPRQPGRIAEQLVHERRNAPELRVGRRRSHRRRPRSAARSASGGRPSRADTGRGSTACPRRRAPRPFLRRARSRGRPPPAPRRSRPSTRAGRSRRARRAVARPRSRARRRRAGLPGPVSPNASTANSFSACAPASPPKTASTGRSAGSPKSARAAARSAPRCATGIGRPTTRYFDPSRPSTAYARKTRRANGAASRFASPRWASASVSAVGIPRSRAASTIGPAT